MLKDMNRLTKGVFLTTLGLVAVLVIGSIAGNFYLGVRLADAQKERASVSQTLDQVQDEYNGLYKEYTDATGGEPDAATPSQVNESVTMTPGKPGSTGATGAVGPRGLMGERGQDGPPGPAGATGAPGSNGADGSDGNDGANGLNGSDGESIKGDTGSSGAAGNDGAAGPPGATGPAGPPGATGAAGANGTNGRGIASTTCNADGSWTIAYTDGSAETASGPCRVVTPDIPGVE